MTRSLTRPGRALPALGFVLALGSPVRAEEPLRLEEKFPEGYQYHVSTRVQLAGSLTTPAEKGKEPSKPLPVVGDSAIDYDERVLATAEGKVQKTARIYRRVELQR